MKYPSITLFLSIWTWTVGISGQTISDSGQAWTTSLAVVTKAKGDITTVTVTVPCPTTSTTYVYECSECESTTTPAPAEQFGTTTLTLYTTETPSVSVSYTTVTSNGVVLVISEPTQVAGTNGANPTIATTLPISLNLCIAFAILLSLFPVFLH